VTCKLNITHQADPTPKPNPRPSGFKWKTALHFTCALIPGLVITLPVSDSAEADILTRRASIDFVSDSSAGGPRSWLDPLRESGRQRSTAEVLYSEDDDAEFNLSEFSQTPDGSSVGSVSQVSRVAEPHLASSLPEPAEPTSHPGSDLESDPFQQSARHQINAQQPMSPQPMSPQTVFSECPPGQYHQSLCWQIMPKGLLYRTYLAGEKEPRMQFLSLYDTRSKRKVWDAVLGGRVGLLRHGDMQRPDADAFQLDLEGAVFARVLPEEESSMLEGSDYRIGLYGTWRRDRLSYRAGYYHISAHAGDEFLIANPTFPRINYVRDSLLAGVSYDVSDITRVYGELGYSLGTSGGAEPFELQLGTEYAPKPQTTATGAPFFAVNAHWREEFGLSTGVNVVSGWGWQGPETRRRLRLGLNYYNGPSLQYEFFDRWENLVGGGIWMDY